MSEDHHHMGILSPQCTSEEMRLYWNKVALTQKPFSEALSTKVYLEQEIKPIEKYLGPKLKGKKILKLDLWNEAFNTDVLIWAANQGIEIYAIDVSDRVVRIARKRMDKHGIRHNFVCADMRNIPFKNNTFDMVYSMGTLEHVEDSQGVIDEIHRVMKKGAVVITGIPNKYDLFFRAPILSLANKLKLAPYGEELSFSKEEINKYFSVSKQFKVIDNDGIFLPWFLRFPDMKLYVKFKPATIFFHFPLKATSYLGKKSKWLRKTSGIITSIARKT